MRNDNEGIVCCVHNVLKTHAKMISIITQAIAFRGKHLFRRNEADANNAKYKEITVVFNKIETPFEADETTIHNNDEDIESVQIEGRNLSIEWETFDYDVCSYDILNGDEDIPGIPGGEEGNDKKACVFNEPLHDDSGIEEKRGIDLLELKYDSVPKIHNRSQWFPSTEDRKTIGRSFSFEEVPDNKSTVKTLPSSKQRKMSNR